MKNHHKHPDALRWNEKYNKRGPENFGITPASWLFRHQAMLRDLAPGKALDIACGNGKNSFFLAEMGFDVDAVDISDVALDWVKAQAANKDFSIHTHQIDLTKAEFPSSDYHVIANMNFLERSLFKSIVEALAPGGIVCFETMYRDETEVLGSQMNPDYLLDYGELLTVFRELRIVAYEERIQTINDRGRQKALASIVARKI